MGATETLSPHGEAGGSRASRRILYAITDLEVGGVPLHLLRLASEVRRRGWTVAVASLKPAGPIAARLEASGVEVLSCEGRGPADWRIFDRLAGFMRDCAPDLVHAFLFHANVACRVAGMLVGFPARKLLCEIQTAEIERRWHLAVDRWTCRLCRCVIGNSPSVVEHLHEHGRIPRSRLRLVMGGIDVAAIEAAEPLRRSELGLPDGVPLLLWVGRMDPVKGLDDLLGAVDRLRRTVDLRVALVGDGAYRPQVEERIAGLGLGELVSLLGRRDDVARVMKAADLFVFPSLTEGLPNALLEAMAAGLPVVATDVPGCRDLVTDCVTGRLAPAADPGALADAVRESLAQPSRTREMALAAGKMASREFTLRACVERYLELYKSVVR